MQNNFDFSVINTNKPRFYKQEQKERERKREEEKISETKQK